MTQTQLNSGKTKKALVKRLVYCYMCLFVTILFFKNTQATSEWVSNGLSLCVKRLIPSLFPFMVVSSLLSTAEVGASLFTVLSKPLGALLGIGAHGTRALLIGWLCGFPVGAKCASRLFHEGYIGEEEYGTLLCVCSTPSPAFVIGSVGTSLLGSPARGILLYSVSLISSLTVGTILCVGKSKHRDTQPARKTNGSYISFSQSMTSAVSDAGLGMLNICAFVVFFSTFLGALDGIISPLGPPRAVRVLIFCFFELTSGIEGICSLGTQKVLPLVSLAIGWSGLSVHFQTMSICGDMGKYTSRYFAFHVLKSALCFAVCSFF